MNGVFFSIDAQIPLAVRFFRRCFLRRSCSRACHSYSHPPSLGPFNPVEHAILSASIPYVPAHGFTLTSLTLGAKDVGYHDVTTNLFPKGEFSIVHYHLVNQRLRLAQLQQAIVSSPHEKRLEVDSMVAALTWERLLGNKQLIHRWQEVRFSPQPIYKSQSRFGLT
jgi:ubiquinone biosynthesis protein COQ9